MNKIKRAYETITLDEESKDRIYYNIQQKSKIKNNKIWIIKRLVPLVSVCACAIIITTNSTFQVKAGEYIKSVVNWITGNTKDDYLEEPKIITSNNNMQFRIKSAKRIESEVRVMYEIVFPDNIEKSINLEEYKDSDNSKELFFSEMFADCKIYINNKYINDIDIIDGEIWCFHVKDMKVKGNMIVQELVLNLNKEYLNSDLNFKFEYNKFNINDSILEANLKTEYTLAGNLYSGEIEVTNIPKVKVDIGKRTYSFYGYSYTKTGIKLYCKEESYSLTNYDVIYLRVIDNYGSKYLFYPKYYNDGTDLIFEIYDGPADWYNEYEEYLKSDITNMKVEIMEETNELDEKGNPISDKVSEFEINFENRKIEV